MALGRCLAEEKSHRGAAVVGVCVDDCQGPDNHWDPNCGVRRRPPRLLVASTPPPRLLLFPVWIVSLLIRLRGLVGNYCLECRTVVAALNVAVVAGDEDNVANVAIARKAMGAPEADVAVSTDLGDVPSVVVAVVAAPAPAPALVVLRGDRQQRYWDWESLAEVERKETVVAVVVDDVVAVESVILVATVRDRPKLPRIRRLARRLEPPPKLLRLQHSRKPPRDRASWLRKTKS